LPIFHKNEEEDIPGTGKIPWYVFWLKRPDQTTKMNPMKRQTMILTLAVLLIAGISWYAFSYKANANVNETLVTLTADEDDAKFIKEAAEGGMMEVKLAQLALTKTTSPEVKKLAQHMLDDHTKANTELKALAAKMNITIPSDISMDNQKMYDNLGKKTGAEFDKEYADMLVKSHKKSISKFETCGEKGKDPELKKWASGKIPVLKHHLEMAQQTQELLKKTPNKTSTSGN
jgi:putative membrane protein